MLKRKKRSHQVPPDSTLIQQLVPGATVTRARALIPDARGAAPESVHEEIDGEKVHVRRWIVEVKGKAPNLAATGINARLFGDEARVLVEWRREWHTSNHPRDVARGVSKDVQQASSRCRRTR